MYLPGQVIYSFDKKAPVKIDDVWDVKEYPDRHEHFIISTGKWDKNGEYFKLFTPRSIAQAKSLLAVGIISPAPAPIHTHCWRCGNWHDNCRAMGCVEGRYEKYGKGSK